VQTPYWRTDASDYGIGIILTQKTERGEKVVFYSRRTLNCAEKNYSTTEKECVAIVWAIRKLKPYLEGYHFKVITDHMALKWLNSIESTSGRIARWELELQQYDFELTGKDSSTWWQMLCQGSHYQRRFEVSRKHRRRKLLQHAADFSKCAER